MGDCLDHFLCGTPGKKFRDTTLAVGPHNNEVTILFFAVLTMVSAGGPSSIKISSVRTI